MSALLARAASAGGDHNADERLRAGRLARGDVAVAEAGPVSPAWCWLPPDLRLSSWIANAPPPTATKMGQSTNPATPTAARVNAAVGVD